MNQPFQILDWDSNFFGFRVARVQPESSDGGFAMAIKLCEKNAVRCAYYLSDISQNEDIRRAETAGFSLADIRISLETEGTVQKTEVPTRRMAPTDLDSIENIAADSFTDTRFFIDPGFPREKAQGMYRQWVRKAAEDSEKTVRVACLEGAAVGFIVCKTHADRGQIELIAVGNQARGKHIGISLVQSALNHFHGQGLHRVFVVTQARNIGAQALYQSAGFRTSKVELWFHKWFPTQMRVAA